MKTIMLMIAALSLAGCERNISKDLESNRNGHVTINGKDCEVFSINIGDGMGRPIFIDCGPGSSSVTYQQGKTQQTVGQYIPPTSEPCPCRRTDNGSLDCPTPPCVKVTEVPPVNSTDLKKAREELREVKKDFYK